VIYSPLEIGVSFVGLRTVNLANFKLLKCIRERKVSLAPSHFGLGSKVESNQPGLDFVHDLASAGVEVTSLQGLMFGLSTQDNSFLRNVEIRAVALLKIAALLKVETLVLGSPDVRQERNLWRDTVRILSEVTQDSEVTLALETICGSTCSEDIGSTLGNLSWADRGGAIALDLSNVYGCKFHKPVQIIESRFVPIVHASGIDHTTKAVEEMALVLLEVSKAMPERAIPTRYVWEFFAQDIASLSQSVEESERVFGKIESNQ
jgi:hypothetical protein